MEHHHAHETVAWTQIAAPPWDIRPACTESESLCGALHLKP